MFGGQNNSWPNSFLKKRVRTEINSFSIRLAHVACKYIAVHSLNRSLLFLLSVITARDERRLPKLEKYDIDPRGDPYFFTADYISLRFRFPLEKSRGLCQARLRTASFPNISCRNVLPARVSRGLTHPFKRGIQYKNLSDKHASSSKCCSWCAPGPSGNGVSVHKP